MTKINGSRREVIAYGKHITIRTAVQYAHTRAARLLRSKRQHWRIENSLHWILDIAFREDESRLRKDHGPQNFAILRHIALNLLQQETTCKLGVFNKRLKAAWDLDYLCTVLATLFKKDAIALDNWTRPLDSPSVWHDNDVIGLLAIAAWLSHHGGTMVHLRLPRRQPVGHHR